MIYPFLYYNEVIRLLFVLFSVLIIVLEVVRMFTVTKSISLINLIFLIYAIYILFYIILNEGGDSTILISCLFFPIVFLSSNSIIRDSNQFKQVLKIQLMMFYIYFLLYLYVRILVGIHSGVVINTIYYQLLLLPFILIIPTRKLKIFTLFLLFTAIIISNKRTAIIAFVIVILIYFILTTRLNETNTKKTWVKIFLGITSFVILLIILLQIGDHFFQLNILDRLVSAIDDGGSGRTSVQGAVLESFFQSDIAQKFFGQGYNSTKNFNSYGLTAHNDFIEILFNFGFIGFLLYLGIYVSLFRISSWFKKMSYKNGSSFTASIFLFLILSLFSHLIFVPTYSAYLSLFWSYCINDAKNTIES